MEAANQNGFIVVFPETADKNCWEPGTPEALTHDGGGETQALAQMIQYALTTYNGDSDRVYVMGGSSGAMMTQAMLAVYPDITRALGAISKFLSWHEQRDQTYTEAPHGV